MDISIYIYIYIYIYVCTVLIVAACFSIQRSLFSAWKLKLPYDMVMSRVGLLYYIYNIYI